MGDEVKGNTQTKPPRNGGDGEGRPLETGGNAYLLCRSILEPTITQGIECMPQKLMILS